MDIKSWKIMLAVDDYGSFTRVGAELGYTQSGITQMMKNLEKKVGFPLYIKDHHGITLTNEAKSLIPAIRTLLNADEVIHQEIAALNGAQRGTIRIGTYLSCSIHSIPKIIREFQQKHPDIIIQVIEGVEGELADWIQERRVDIGFISLQKNHKYQFLPVMNDLMYAVVPENDPLAKEEEILTAAAKNEKPDANDKIITGMVKGRLNKELKEICLMDQVYVKAEDGKQSVSKYVEEVAKANNAKIAIKGFVRMETGEGIEKKEEDFAAEVAAQMAGK